MDTLRMRTGIKRTQSGTKKRILSAALAWALTLALAVGALFAGTPVCAAEAAAEPLPDGRTVSPTASTVYVDGAATAFEAYTIDGSNYFKLRDLAAAFSGSEKQFGVGYDGAEDAITLTGGTPYSNAGGELAAGDGMSKSAAPTTSKVFLDGRELKLTAYNISGNNFFKLRDLMKAVDVYVGYDDATRAITLDTGRGYEEPPAVSPAEPSAADAPSDAATLAYGEPFADYNDYVYSGTPSIPDYTVAADLANVVNLSQFSPGDRDWNTPFGYWHSDNELSGEATGLIGQNGFAVSDKFSYAEFFQLYEANRYNSVPNFITTDSATHTFHLMFDYVLKDLEQNRLYDILLELGEGMAAASYEQYGILAGTPFENAALRNVAFFSVGSKLLDGGFDVPDEVSGVVEQELTLINAQKGIAVSPVVNLGGDADGPDAYKADYSQFIPRSHYNQTPQLQGYFKAMMWYGQITFRSRDEDAVKSALLQTSALTDAGLSSLWADIFEPTNFFVGACDDISYYQYAAALEDIYGAKLGSAAEIARDGALFAEAFAAIGRMPPPRVNSTASGYGNVSAGDTEAGAGYRFLGQRFTLDAYIFQNLVHETVKGRMMPNSLDIPAAFGSDTALELLSGDVSAYPGYPGQMTKLRSEMSRISKSEWTSNLYWSWMYMLLPYTDDEAGAGYPMFMRNAAWARKELNSFQGSWTELKHDTLLYAKQAVSEGDGGDEFIPERPDDRGYVEPNPVVFGRLAALVNQTVTGLRQRDILTPEADEALGVLFQLSTRLTEISEKELSNAQLSDADYEFIRGYGAELEHIWDTAKSYEMTQTLDSGDGFMGGSGDYLGQHPCGVIADVATNPLLGEALEEATGYAKTIFVVFPRDGKLVLASGAVFSQYEFTVPMSGRVTDEQWHERMIENDLPEPAAWKRSYLCDIDQTRYSY